MFKYVKNLNGSHATPEVIEIPVVSSETIPEGTLGSYFEEYIEFYNGGRPGRSYITVENKESDDGKTTIKVIKALPGMVFEVPLADTTTVNEISVGKLISSRENNASKHVKVCPEEGTFIEVVSTADFKSTGKILVTFI